jgi:hypothetical protein
MKPKGSEKLRQGDTLGHLPVALCILYIIFAPVTIFLGTESVVKVPYSLQYLGIV